MYNFGVKVWEAVFSKNQKYIAVAGQKDNVDILNGSTLGFIRSIDTNHNNIVYDVDFRYNS